MAQTADPLARDVASTARLLCEGKVSCQTQGEDPVFDDDGDGRLDILLAGRGGAPWALMLMSLQRLKMLFPQPARRRAAAWLIADFLNADRRRL